jgi:hypothetical protein
LTNKLLAGFAQMLLEASSQSDEAKSKSLARFVQRMLAAGGRSDLAAMLDWQLGEAANVTLARFAQKLLDATDQAVEATMLDWEILPPGYMGTYLQRAANGGTAVERDRSERIAYLDELRPRRWWMGRSPLKGKQRYLLAEFESCVVAESPVLGNALFTYSFSGGAESWQQVFCEEKRVAERLGARRIVHRGDWRERLRRAVEDPRT